MLARHHVTPAIVVKSGEAAPLMLSPFTSLCSPCGEAEYTCCSRGHLINGRQIACDKTKIAPMIWEMLQTRQRHALEKGESVSEASLYRLAKRAAAGRGMKEEL